MQEDAKMKDMVEVVLHENGTYEVHEVAFHKGYR